MIHESSACQRLLSLQAINVFLPELMRISVRLWQVYQEREALSELIHGLAQGLKTDRTAVKELNYVSIPVILKPRYDVSASRIVRA